jgi:hypothetical protein
MALSILDGNQSATTLSTILSSGQHITAHTVISLGTQAITDIVNATSANLTNTQLRASAVTVGGTVAVGNSLTISSLPALSAGTAQIGSVTASISNSLTISSLPAISGTVTISNFPSTQLVEVDGGAITIQNGIEEYISSFGSFPIAGTVTASPTGTQTIAGSVTLGAGTVQIGSVTASISGTVPVSGTFFQGTQPVSLTTLPALVAGTAQIGSVTASISNTVVTFYPMQGTTVTNSNFTSTTPSTTLVSAVAGREVLTVFNEGAGNLFISAGATATTISYQVRLSAGDYWECPAGQLSLAHTAVFATAGTARVTEVS